MRQLSDADQDYVYSLLREGAITLDEAEHGRALRKRDANFILAQGILRGWRRTIEARLDRETLARYLKELDQELSLVAGSATEAIAAARGLVQKALLRIESLATCRIDAGERLRFLALHTEWLQQLPSQPNQFASEIVMLSEGAHIHVGERREITYHRMDPRFLSYLRRRNFSVRLA